MKRIGIVAILVIAMVAAMAGCGTSTPAPSATEAPAATDAPAVSEAPAATDASSEAPAENVTIKTAGSTSVGPVIEALAEKYMAANSNVEITVEAGGSGVGVTSAAEKSVDFGMSSRDLNDDEVSANPDMKTTLLCLDGVAIVVNSANTGVTDLTVDQIKKIYMGEITDWSEVGGTAGKINLYTRDAASGTREAFQTLFLGKDDKGEQIEIDETICAGIFDSTGAVGSAVQGDPMGIGYMSLGVVPEYDGVQSVKVNGVEATVDNMLNGTYIYMRPFNLLTMGDPAGEVAKFFEYCTTSEEAKTYMQEKGYVLPTA
jgi:phosphate transport system substrate-binding protein